MIPFLYAFNILFFGYVLVCTGIGFFVKAPGHLFPEELYWPTVLTSLLAALFLYERPRLSSFSIRRFIQENLDVFFVLLLVLGLRIYLMTLVEPWLDEDYQGFSSLIHRSLIAGVWQHQPPLDMVLTKFGVLLSKESLWGLRMHSVLCSAFASALLYDQAKKISRSRLIALFCAVFFTFNVVVVQYGYEARPLSLGLLFCVGFLGLNLSLLSERKDSFYFKTPIFNCLITFGFLNSLGMQPVILVGVSAVFLAVYILSGHSWIKKYFLSVLFAMGLFIPIQIYILRYAPPRFTKQAGFNLSAFGDELIRLDNFKVLQDYFWPLGCVFLILCLLSFALQIKKVRSISSSTLFLFFLSSAFALFLVPFFKSHVSWEMYTRYFALVLPVVLLGTGLILRQTLDLLPLSKTVFYSFVILFFAPASFFYSWGPIIDLNSVYKPFEMKSAFTLLNEKSTDRDIDLPFCLHTGGYCPNTFVLQSFHYKKAIGGIAGNWVPTFDRFLTALRSPVAPENIFFLYYSVWSDRELPLKTSFQIKHLHGVDVLEVPVKSQNLAQTMIDFCKPYVDYGLSENVLYVGPLEYIVAAAEASGQTELKNSYLKLYQDFTGKKADSSYLNALIQNR